MIGPLNLNYKSLVESFDAKLVTFDSFLSADKRKQLILRHDVDSDLNHAVIFAEKEASYGFKSTFFLLHSARYFNYSNVFFDRCKKLIDLGHSIGFHNNLLVEWMRYEKTPTKTLHKVLEYFRRHKIPINWTSSHGAAECRVMNFNNFEIWKEYPGKLKLDNIQLSLAKYGLHEVYFQPFDFYFSDSGSKWRGGNVNGKGYWFERDFPFLTNSGLVASKNSNVQLLTHPKWWKI